MADPSLPAPSRIQPGTLIDHFRLDSLLGKGGMGAVYLAEDTNLGRPVALKVLSPALLEVEGYRERFRRVARSAARLAHPNIISVFHFGEAQGLPYFAMEYVPGTPVDRLLSDQGSLPPGQALELLLQVLAGLAHAHEHGVIHRDLKPANLILGKDGRARILDFGLARATGSTGLTSSGVVLGTPDYMSPEQGLGKPVDHTTDVYSCGVMLFELLSGRLPFRGDSALEVMMAHVQEPPPRLAELHPALPDTLAAVVERCLAKDPADRYQDYSALADDLRASLPAVQEMPRLKPRSPEAADRSCDGAPLPGKGAAPTRSPILGAGALPSPRTSPPEVAFPPFSWFPPRHVPRFLWAPRRSLTSLSRGPPPSWGRILATWFSFGLAAGLLSRGQAFGPVLVWILVLVAMLGPMVWAVARLRGSALSLRHGLFMELWTCSALVFLVLGPGPGILTLSLYHLLLAWLVASRRAGRPEAGGLTGPAAPADHPGPDDDHCPKSASQLASAETIRTGPGPERPR